MCFDLDKVMAGEEYGRKVRIADGRAKDADIRARWREEKYASAHAHDGQRLYKKRKIVKQERQRENCAFQTAGPKLDKCCCCPLASGGGYCGELCFFG